MPLNSYSQNWQARTDFIISPDGLFSNVKEKGDNGIGGATLSVQYIYQLSRKFDVSGGLEFYGNSIANHTLIKLAGSFNFLHREKDYLTIQAEIGNGIALFSPRPLYSMNSSILFYWNYITKKNSVWSLGIGAQYFSTPRYSSYSKRYKFFTIPTSLKYSF